MRCGILGRSSSQASVVAIDAPSPKPLRWGFFYDGECGLHLQMRTSAWSRKMMITDRKSESIKRQSSFAIGPSEKSSTEGRVSSTERKAVRTFSPLDALYATLFFPLVPCHLSLSFYCRAMMAFMVISSSLISSPLTSTFTA